MKKDKEPKINKNIFNLIRNKSVEEINAKESKLVSEDEIQRIVNNNFNKIYKENLSNYNSCLEEKKEMGTALTLHIGTLLIPFLVSAIITSSFAGGYALANKGNNDVAFNKYHGYYAEREAQFISSDNPVWSDIFTADDVINRNSYIKTEVPKGDGSGLVDVDYYCFSSGEKAQELGNKLQTNPDEVIYEYAKYAPSTSSESSDYTFMEYNPDLEKPRVSILYNNSMANKKEIISDEKKEEFDESNYHIKKPRKKIVKGVAVTTSIISLITDIFIFANCVLEEETVFAEYLEAKTNFKLAKRKKKDLYKK